MRAGDFGVIAGAMVVAVAAILGGAFLPGPRLIVGVLASVVIFVSVMTWRERLEVEEWLVLVFIAWGACSAVVSMNSPLAAREAVASWVIAWSLWLFARRATERAAVLGAGVVLMAAGLLVFGIVLEVVGLGDIRVGGLLENPNVAAALVVLALPLVFTLDLTRRPWLRFVLIVELVVGVVLTGSRAGLLALLAAAAVALPRGRIRAAGVSVGVLGAAGVLFWRFVSQPDVLAWFRPSIWSAVLRSWAAHPVFGVGPGGLVDAAGPVRLLHADHVGQRQFLIAYAESSPLAVLVQTGAVGCLLAVVALSLWFRRSRENGVLDSTVLRTGLWAMAVMAAFHDFLNVGVVIWWWALVLGLSEAATGKISSTTTTTRGRTAQAVGAVVLSFIVLWGVVQPSWARWLWSTEVRDEELVDRVERAEPALDQPLEWRVRAVLSKPNWTWEDTAEALARSRRAVSIHPGAARLWALKGVVSSRIVNDFGVWPETVEEARSAFARSVDLEPHQPWALLEWARLERGLGNSDQAVSLIRRALEAEPHTVRARLFLARLMLDRAELEQAREALEAARESAEKYSPIGLNDYEKELLQAPEWQIREIDEALR